MNLTYIDRPTERQPAPLPRPQPTSPALAAALELAPLIALIGAWLTALLAVSAGGVFVVLPAVFFLVAAFGTGAGWILARMPAIGWTLGIARSIAAVVLGVLFVQALGNALCESATCRNDAPFLPAPATYLIFSLVIFGPIISAIVLTLTLRLTRAASTA